MKKIKMCLFGLNIFSANKGCVALAYSFLELLSFILVKKNKSAKIDLFILYPYGKEFPSLPYVYDNLEISINRVSIKRFPYNIKLLKLVLQSDICFDFTEGDSFSDIYGFNRFFKQTLIKLIIIFFRKKLILGPQTYGPFYNFLSEYLATLTLKKSFLVFSRDKKSGQLVKKISGIDTIITTDIAFILKPSSFFYPIKKGNNIGINISGLLYNGGYTGNNQFNLTVNYQDYIDELINALSLTKKYNIYLIPHVICDDYNNCENDLLICNLVKSKYTNCIVVDCVENPKDLKKVIMQMNVFIGARMHSTIAAFSAGVPTIPFSYSKKFEDLYFSIGYEYIIDGKKMTNNEAIQKTLEYINNIDELREIVQKSNLVVNAQLNCFKTSIIELIDNILI